MRYAIYLRDGRVVELAFRTYPPTLVDDFYIFKDANGRKAEYSITAAFKPGEIVGFCQID